MLLSTDRDAKKFFCHPFLLVRVEVVVVDVDVVEIDKSVVIY